MARMSHAPGAQDPGRQLVENSLQLIAAGCRYLLIAMFARDGATHNLYGQRTFEDGSTAVDRDPETRKVRAALERFRKDMPAEIGIGVDVHSLLDPLRAVQFCKDVEPFRLFYCEDLTNEKPGWGIEVDEALAAKHPITDEHPNEFRAPDGSIIQGTG